MRYLAIIFLALQALGATAPRVSFNAATTNDVPPYMGTNANLVALQAYTQTTWQSTNANLTLLSAFGPNTWQATNANLTLLQAHGPTTWQATNEALTALASNPSLYQATNANLTSWAALSTNDLMTKWDDLMVPGTTIKTGASAPTFGNFGSAGGLQVYLFQATTVDDQCYLAVQLPHAWKEGTGIRPHVHWTQTAATTAGSNVVWGLEYWWANVNGIGTTNTIFATNGISTTNWFHQLSQLPEIPGTSKTLSSILNCRLFRAGNSATADDYDKDAAFLQFDIHYQRDSNGSTGEYTK